MYIFISDTSTHHIDPETTEVDVLLNNLSSPEIMASHPGLRSSLNQIEQLVKKQLSFTEDDSDDSTTPQAPGYVGFVCFYQAVYINLLLQQGRLKSIPRCIISEFPCPVNFSVLDFDLVFLVIRVKSCIVEILTCHIFSA